jgi:integrase
MKVTKDSIVTGLQLREFKTGSSYYLYYRTKNGTERRPRICDASLGISKARQIAKEILASVAVGGDPKAEWVAMKNEITFKQLFEKVLEEHWSQDRFVQSGYKKEVESIFSKHLASHGKLKLSDITPPMVNAWHTALRKTPNMANRMLSLITKMFNYAEEMGIRELNTNPAARVKKFPEKKRKTFATKEELSKMLTILGRDLETNRASVCFIYLLMFTGSRPSAIENAKKEDLQPLDNGHYLLSFHGKSSAKTGEEEEIIIPNWIVEILPEGPSLTGIKMPRRYWGKVQKEIGNEELWARDLRRTFATIGLSGGIGLGMIAEILNHKTTQTTKRYAKLIDETKYETSIAIANMIKGLEND